MEPAYVNVVSTEDIVGWTLARPTATVMASAKTLLKTIKPHIMSANVIPVGQGITAKFQKKQNAKTKLTTTKMV
jgi:hypothetical protein